MWVMDDAPSKRSMAPKDIRETFASLFRVARFEKKRRRLVPSWWYWLARVVDR
jgi:hypothetical protein